MRGQRWARALTRSGPAQALRSSRLLQASAGLALVALIWFMIFLHRPTGPPILLWIPTPVAAVILTIVYVRTSRTMTLPAPTRRFWRHLSFTAGLVGIGCISQAADALADPDRGGPYTGPVMLCIDAVAVGVIIYALYRLPLGHRSAGDLSRVAMDAGTVVLATATFMWHFQARPTIGTHDSKEIVTAMMVTVLALTAVLAVAKVVLSSYTFIDKRSLRLFALAMVVGSLGPQTQELLGSRTHLLATQVSIPLVFFLAALSGEMQRQAPAKPARGSAPAPRRPFSLLPYVAVAAVDVLLVAVIWTGDDARVVGIAVVAITGLVVLRQITAFRDNGRLLSRLDHGATHDALTLLPNRVLFGERLSQALSIAGDHPVSVALIDLDDFKEVNDTLGHEVGDLVLVAVAQRLAACVRQDDTVARLGGDEFVAILDGADPAAAELAVQRMINALQVPVIADGHELPVRASIGIAAGRPGDEPSDLLRRSDIAMYAAKNIAGSAHLHFDDTMVRTVNEHISLGAELREALDADQLFLLYQPIVSLDDARIIGAEALVRWTHPVRGVLAPDLFIPFAERTGLIVPLSRWVLREACRQLAVWTRAYGEEAPAVLNINVSARDLHEADFAAHVGATLAEHGIRPDRIVLEVTETMIMELGAPVTALQELKALGVRISLDDFGTGHSTLTLLHHCPVDEIKLDRSFVQAEVDDRPTMAAAVIHLAQALGLHAVAEGIETTEQADLLLSLGYVAAQGYLFARPLPSDGFDALLRDGGDLRPAAPRPPVGRPADPAPGTGSPSWAPAPGTSAQTEKDEAVTATSNVPRGVPAGS
jgi:diguanylate cyclase (GGDEF)-like protein